VAPAARSEKAVAIVPQETARKATAAPVVIVAKEDVPVAAAPSKWPPRSNSKN
jgi:hypothetical protein